MRFSRLVSNIGLYLKSKNRKFKCKIDTLNDTLYEQKARRSL